MNSEMDEDDNLHLLTNSTPILWRRSTLVKWYCARQVNVNICLCGLVVTLLLWVGDVDVLPRSRPPRLAESLETPAQSITIGATEQMGWRESSSSVDLGDVAESKYKMGFGDSLEWVCIVFNQGRDGL
jgi:hypothetical protein